LQPNVPFVQQSTIYYSDKLAIFPVDKNISPSNPPTVEKAQQAPHDP